MRTKKLKATMFLCRFRTRRSLSETRVRPKRATVFLSDKPSIVGPRMHARYSTCDPDSDIEHEFEIEGEHRQMLE